MTQVRELMTSEVVSFRPDTPLEVALRTLIDKRISGAPVVDGSNAIVGVISEADLLSLFWETEAKLVGEIMTSNPRAFPVDGPLVDVVDCLMSNSFRRVLIHDGDGKLVGLVSRADMMPSVLDALMERRGAN